MNYRKTIHIKNMLFVVYCVLFGIFICNCNNSYFNETYRADDFAGWFYYTDGSISKELITTKTVSGIVAGEENNKIIIVNAGWLSNPNGTWYSYCDYHQTIWYVPDKNETLLILESRDRINNSISKLKEDSINIKYASYLLGKCWVREDDTRSGQGIYVDFSETMDESHLGLAQKKSLLGVRCITTIILKDD